MNLPPEFVSNIQNVFKENGYAFLKALPDLIAEASIRWNLTDVQPAPTLSYNFVAFAKRASTTLPVGRSATQRVRRQRENDVVLKMGVPNREMLSEMEALRLFDGDGACKLLEYDEEKCWMLLERLNPGEMLVSLKDDEESTHIAAEVMRKIWRPLENVTPPQERRGGVSDSEGSLPVEVGFFGREDRSLRMTNSAKFIKLSDWFDALKRIRPTFGGTTGPFNEKILQRVEHWVNEAFAENHHPVLMHGDFHHYNILSSERGWLIIDPKGVMGPAGYEVGPLLMNPWGDLLNETNYRMMTKRRIDILHEHLGFERERIHAWGLAHAVLSAWWCIEDNVPDEYSLSFAEMIAGLDIK